jgi:di/tricarboxylate transporter
VFGGLNPQQIVFLAILAIALVLFITEWIRPDVAAVLVVIALYLSRTLKPDEALSGFSSEPAIVIAGIFVVSAALHATGLSDRLGEWIGKFAGNSLGRAIAVIMPSVAVLSAFTHHVTTTAVMLPITLDLSRERKLPPSKLLMPMSFAASLGTAITIIGAPAFLIASTILQQGGRPGLGIFSIAPIGLAMTVAGTLFILLVGRFLLPAHKGGDDAARYLRLEDYLTEIALTKDSPLVGRTGSEVQNDPNYHFTLAGVIRNEKRLRGGVRNQELKEGDVLIVRTTPEELLSIRKNKALKLRPIKLYGAPKSANGKEEENGDEDGSDLFVQAVVAPRSDLIGRTVSETDFRRRYGAVVVGLWRKDGWLNQEVSKVKLRANDVLVLEGEEEALARVSADKSFLMLVPFQAEHKLRDKRWLAGAIMLLTILLAAFNLLTIEMAALTGAVLVVLTGCMSVNQAYHSIDTKIFVFIGGAIPLGTAMQKTGTATLLGSWLQHAVGGWPERAVLLLIFAIVAVITQFMSDSATTALFAPVAVALAQALGRPPEPYVVTVAMASVVAFLTPIGHHGNLLVYGPGRYKFSDFVKVGTPLTVICALIVVLLAPLIWRS